MHICNLHTLSHLIAERGSSTFALWRRNYSTLTLRSKRQPPLFVAAPLAASAVASWDSTKTRFCTVARGCRKGRKSFCSVSLVTPHKFGDIASGNEHFEVWPHDAIEAKRPRHLVEFVEVEASAPPRFDEAFHRNVQADLVSESKAVDNRSGDAVNPHHAAFDAMLFDAEIEERWRNPCDADGRVCNQRDASAARNGEPYLPGQLCPEIVKEKSR